MWTRFRASLQKSLSLKKKIHLKQYILLGWTHLKFWVKKKKKVIFQVSFALEVLQIPETIWVLVFTMEKNKYNNLFFSFVITFCFSFVEGTSKYIVLFTHFKTENMKNKVGGVEVH